MKIRSAQSSSRPSAARVASRLLQETRRPTTLAVVIAVGLLTTWGVAASKDSRAKAEAAIESVKTDERAAAIAAEPLKKAEDALGRSTSATESGDTSHARLLDDLALEWAETAVDLARTAELEAAAVKTEQESVEVEAQTRRAKALLEQTAARRGRAEAKLQDLGEVPEQTPEPEKQQPAKQPGEAKP